MGSLPKRSFSTGGNWWDDDASSKPGKSESSIFDNVDESKLPATKKLDDSENLIRRRSSLFTAAPQRREPIVKGTPKLTMSEALFLAKEAGIFTTREIQTHIVKSPSFSTNKSPFLLEDFFTEQGAEGENEMLVKSMKKAATDVGKSEAADSVNNEDMKNSVDTVPKFDP